MKNLMKLFIVAISILLCYGVFAQDTTIQWPKNYPKPGGYGQNPNFQKFIGTWQWQLGDTVFVIVLEKYIFKSSIKTGRFKGYSEDKILGWHEYRIGETIIESSLENVKKNPDGNTKRTISGGSIDDVDMLSSLFFIDLSRNKNGVATLELLPGEKDLARWTLKGTPGVKILGPGEEPDYTFTVPTNVIMRRIKKKNK